MIFEHDIHVPHRGGLWLSANVYRPDDSGQKPVPVIVSLGPYNKERHTTEVEPFESRLLTRQGPTVVYERFEGNLTSMILVCIRQLRIKQVSNGSASAMQLCISIVQVLDCLLGKWTFSR